MTAQRIFTLDGSHDADSRKDVQCILGTVDITPHLGVKCLPSVHGGMNGIRPVKSRVVGC